VPADLAPAERATLENIVRRLEAAWNAMDGLAFAAPSAADGEFVNRHSAPFLFGPHQGGWYLGDRCAAQHAGGTAGAAPLTVAGR
jgi:hypothetical protein